MDSPDRRSHDRKNGGRAAAALREHGPSWAALLIALAAQMLFWLLLGYREPESGEIPTARRGVSLLSRRAFSGEAADRRFRLWMERHDPANFLRSGAPGGFSSLLPSAETERLSVEQRKAPAVPVLFDLSAAEPHRTAAAASGGRRPAPLLLPPAPVRAAAVRAAAGRPRILRADGSEMDFALSRRSLPEYAGSPRETLLAVIGALPCRRIELFRSCGIAELDRLALAETTRHLALLDEGELLTVEWPTGAAAVKGGTAP